MKILFGIQATGHGHISRAREIIPHLQRRGRVDLLFSGGNCRMKLEAERVFNCDGISFQYDDRGGISLLKTLRNLKPVQFIRDVSELKLNDYDLVISDFEPVTAWAARRGGVPSVALSHQAAFLSPRTPRPMRHSLMAEQVLRHFAPCERSVGFHFDRYDDFVEPPIIRSEVRELMPYKGEHITVYLPAYDEQWLVKQFQKLEDVRWEVFSAQRRSKKQDENVTLFPIDNDLFLSSLQGSRGVMTGGGFETCAEALFLGKKLLSVPVHNQYEQLCNAAALADMGVPVLDRPDEVQFHEEVKYWLNNDEAVALKETADVSRLVATLLREEAVVPSAPEPLQNMYAA